MAAPVVYRSTDSSAPVLTGTAGDLVNLLDKCLVAGYTGKTAAGWSKPYTATNAAVFRMGAGNQFYLDVNDNGASNGLTGASGQEAAVRGYEVMTAASTGTGPFPTTAQVAAATANWRKSATANATARGWFVIADDRSFIIGIQVGDSPARYLLHSFGDFYSTKSSDAYRTHLSVRTSVNGTSTPSTLGGTLSTNSATGTSGIYVARIAAGTGASVNEALVTVGSSWEIAASFTGALDGNVSVAPLLLFDVSSVLRGRLRGLYQIQTPIGLADADTFTGTGDFAGRAFVVVYNFVQANQALAVETTAWDTSS